MSALAQNKQKEIEFFDRHAVDDAYDVFTPESNQRIVDAFVRLTGLQPGARVADLGCGSGAFTNLLRQAGYEAVGLDISPKLVALGQQRYPGLQLFEGDVEALPFQPGSFDGVLLSGIVHHLPNPSRCAAETCRVLRSGGRFFAFDPNRMNPFMWLYRDRSSPFYSSVGVTENERPVLARTMLNTFRQAGFDVDVDYLAGLAYRYIASSRVRPFLLIYNTIDRFVFNLRVMKNFRPFVLTHGVKQ